MSPKEPQDLPYVLREDRDAVAFLTLNRPHSRNALSMPMIDALLRVFDAIAEDVSVHVVVLAGNGPAFCAGHDLKEMRAHRFDKAYAETLFDTCARLMQRIVSLPQPVIARIHGVATAAGLQLVASCDLAVAADTARFATPGVNIGLFCSTPMVALSRNVSHKHAMQLLLTGEMIDAATALRIGLINEAIAESKLDATTIALAENIAAKSRHTVSIGKAAFYHQAELPTSQAYDFARAVMTANLQTPDAQEGITAFIDKRPPNWCN